MSPRCCGSNLRKIQIPVVASPTETVYLIVYPIVVLQYGFVKPGLKKSEGLYRLFILFRSTVFTEESYNLFRIMCGNMILYASGFWFLRYELEYILYNTAYIVKTAFSGDFPLKDYIEERAVEIAGYIIETKATVRQAAKKFGISKSTVHMDVTKEVGMWRLFMRWDKERDRVGKDRRNAVFFFWVNLLCYGWKSVKIEHRK